MITKEEFNNIEVLKQIDYINNQLELGGTLTSITKDIGIGRSTLTDRFKKVNYTYNKSSNSYIYTDSNTDVKKVIKPAKQQVTQKIDNSVQAVVTDSNTDVELMQDIEIQKNLVSIAQDYTVLKDMIELFKKNSNILSNQISIDLDDTGTSLTTFRINNTVLEDFNSFMEEHKEFKKMDLVSMALKEYIKNHQV